MDLKSKSLIELKALAYDEIAGQQVSQNRLELINQEIVRRLTPAPKNETRSEVANDTQPVSEGK